MTMIDNTTIFAKSEKGRVLLSNSSRELSKDERQVLIMVDGKKTASELITQLSIFKNVASTLESLFEKGLIQASKVSPSLKARTKSRTQSGLLEQENEKVTYQLTQNNLTVLEKALVEFLGPMGRFIFFDILEKESTFDAVNTAILAEISPNQHERYREIIATQLE